MAEGGPQEHRQDLYSGRSIRWTWVGVGALIVLGVETLLGSTLAAFGLSTDAVPAYLAAMVAAFVGGGALVGWLSPGWTAWEAGYAGALAALWSAFLAYRLLDLGGGALGLLPVAVVVGVVAGVAGGQIGERVQHR